MYELLHCKILIKKRKDLIFIISGGKPVHSRDSSSVAGGGTDYINDHFGKIGTDDDPIEGLQYSSLTTLEI
jgi:hypothetical protein